MNFYKHHLGDYAAGTSHLTWDEDCAYRRLIDQYYKREAPIPADLKEACRLARAQTPAQRRAVEAVLKEFFDLREDGWHQKRCDEELAEAAELGIDRDAKNANEKERQRRHREMRRSMFEFLRGHGLVPKWDTTTETLRAMCDKATGDAPVTQPVTSQVTEAVTQPVTPDTANQTPDTRYQKIPPTPKPATSRFDEFWSAWPAHERKQDKAKCADKWRKAHLDEAADRILADIVVKRQTEKWRGGFIEAPLVYLNGRRWEDGVQPQQGTADDWTRSAQ